MKFATTKKTARKAVKKTARPAVKKAAAKKAAPRKPLRKAVPVAPEGPSVWLDAVRAAESKKATAIRVLDLKPVTSFADYFVLCNGANQRQIQAITDEVMRVLKEKGERPTSVEGYDNAEWVLVDYGDMVIHVFSEQARGYYDLDRLWRDAPEMPVPAGS